MMAGRKTKYTPETVKRLTDAIALGATDKLACAYAGIDESTFYAWLKAKTEFSDAIKEAEGKGAITWLAKIEKAATDGNWQAAAWKLERRYPQMYGRTIDVTSKGDKVKAYIGFSPDEWDKETQD
jgi:transposase